MPIQRCNSEIEWAEGLKEIKGFFKSAVKIEESNYWWISPLILIIYVFLAATTFRIFFFLTFLNTNFFRFEFILIFQIFFFFFQKKVIVNWLKINIFPTTKQILLILEYFIEFWNNLRKRIWTFFSSFWLFLSSRVKVSSVDWLRADLVPPN